MLKYISFVYYFVFCSVLAFGADNVFTGGGDELRWLDKENWSMKEVPRYNADSSMLTYIGKNAKKDFNICIDQSAESGKVWLGRPEDPIGSYTLNIVNDANYNLMRMYVGKFGALNIKNGVMTTEKFLCDIGEVNIISGSLNVVSGDWRIKNNGTVTVNQGGILRIQNGKEFSDYSAGSLEKYNIEFNGRLNLYGGKLIMDGDCRKAIQSHIDRGQIIAYGGKVAIPVIKTYMPETNTTIVSTGIAANIWTGSGDGSTWSDIGNWSLNKVPEKRSDVSGLDQYVFVGPYIGKSCNVSICTCVDLEKVWLGRPEDSKGKHILNIGKDGNISCQRLYLGSRGVLNVDGGIVKVSEFICGAGRVNVLSGELVIKSGNWRLFSSDSSMARITLNGGVLKIKSDGKFAKYSTDEKPYNPEFKGVIDIRSGSLVVDGDCQKAIEWHVKNKNIVAYSGNLGVKLKVFYDSEMNTTIASTDVGLNAWIGSGDGESWEDSANWSMGVVPKYNIDNSIFTYIGMDAKEGCDVYVGDRATSGKVWLGRSEDPVGDYALNIGEGASYYLNRLYVGRRGFLNINGGELNTWEGKFDNATVNIDGGQLIIRSNWWSFLRGSIVTVNDGVLRIKNGNTFSRHRKSMKIRNPEFDGTINFCGGKLMMDGDCREALQWHIDNGNIIAFGDAPNTGFDVIYDKVENLTILQPLNLLAARYTWPANGINLTVDSRKKIQINWESGEDVGRLEGYNIYVCDSDWDGFALVNGKTTPYKGNTCQLDVVPGRTYRWKIDEIVAGTGEVIQGDVWTVAINDSLLKVDELTHEGGVHKLNYQWIACGDGRNWKDPLNWHSEVKGLLIPTYQGHEGDRVSCSMDSIMDIDTFCFAGNFWLGKNQLRQSVNLVDKGYWQLYRLYMGSKGVIDIGPQATLKLVHIGSWGGNIEVKGHLRIVGPHWSFKQVDDEGSVKLLDGMLEITEMPLNSPFMDGEIGNIDIYDGIMQVKGNQLESVSKWIDDKHIIAYGISDSNSIVESYYDSNLDITFVTGRKHPMLAYEPNPMNTTLEFVISKCLSWKVNRKVDKCTVYMGKYLKADLTGDGTVDIEDLGVLINGGWGNCTRSGLKSDVNGDGKLDLCDLDGIASEWYCEGGFAKVGSVRPDSNSMCSYTVKLDPETKYIWRIDTETSEGYHKGNLWTFSTGEDPMAVSNEYPVDGDNNIVKGAVSLAWEVCDSIESCNVYFGDSYNAVASADTPSSEYKINTAENVWTCPSLRAGRWYFWRIDTIDDTIVRRGKVWSFKVTDVPVGLYVENGILKRNGFQFKGYGVNYITAFTRTLLDPTDVSYKEGFAVLGQKQIPFAKIWASGFNIIDWQLYFEDKERYFELFDGVMASAEENNVGIIFSMFWTWNLVPDIAGEHISAWADPESKSCKFMETYIREVYERYMNNSAFLGWELGNCYNYSAERNILAPVKLPIFGHPSRRDDVEDRLNMDILRRIAANFVSAVRKVDKNRMITNGFGIRYNTENLDKPYGTLPERYEDHEMVDVACIHYYATGGANSEILANAVSDAASWGKPLFVGQFGISEKNPNKFKTVEDGLVHLLKEMQMAGVPLACIWVYDYQPMDTIWNIEDKNFRGYMLDRLSDVNRSFNP